MRALDPLRIAHEGDIYTVVWWQEEDQEMCYRTLDNFADARRHVETVLWFETLCAKENARGEDNEGIEFVALIDPVGEFLVVNRNNAVTI